MLLLQPASPPVSLGKGTGLEVLGVRSGERSSSQPALILESSPGLLSLMRDCGRMDETDVCCWHEDSHVKDLNASDLWQGLSVV